MSARTAPRASALVRRLRGWYGFIHQRLSNRGDTEHEQALIRIGIVGGLLVYAVLAPLQPPKLHWWVPSVAQVGYIVGALSILHFGWIVIEPRVHQARRTVWMAIDHAAIVLAMAVGGEPMALLYPLLLWVSLGHGFRYGPKYLIGSALISTTLFAPLVLLHPFWQAKGAFGVGLILGLVLIPGYCYRLLRHLHDARRRAEASSDAKSRFLATMSHELRTPLHAILGMSDLLRGTSLEREQRDMTRTIHTAGHGLLNMIEDILDIARIEAGAARNEVSDFDVVQLLQSIRDMLGYQAQTKGLSLRLRLDADLIPLLTGPRRSLEQILINLVANAIKFTEQGEVRIAAALVDVENRHANLKLTVSDTGCGIAPAAQSRIFDSFTQADETTTRRYGGSGLGLSIVKRLVELAGGSIELASEVDRGTRFTVLLPVAVGDDVAIPAGGSVVVHGTPTPMQLQLLGMSGVLWRPANQVQNAVVAANSVDLWCWDQTQKALGHRHGRDLIAWGDYCASDDALIILPVHASAAQLRRAIRAGLIVVSDPDAQLEAARVQTADTSLDVLVADDHQINRDVIERLLVRGGHRAVLVDCGEAALAAADHSNFDVVVLDLNMPGMGGTAAARALAAQADHPRLVALTADATSATRDACMAGGFDDFLTKPVDSSRLLEAIEGRSPPVAVKQSAPTAVTTANVLDERRIAMLRDLDEGDGFVTEIIDGFILDGRGLVKDIKAAAAVGDVERFRDAAHALRSAATHLGATELFERCIAIKRLEENTLRERAVAIGAELDEAFDIVAAALIEVRPAPPAKTADAPRPKLSSPTA